MTGPLVILKLAQGKVKATLAERVSPAWFQAYRQACDRGGARWSMGAQGNLAPMIQAPRLREALAATGFRVEVAKCLAEALSGTAQHLAGRSRLLQARLSAIASTLETQGKLLGQYQREGAEWLSPCDRALLGDQQGLGKTLQLLAAAPAGRPVIVTCPGIAKGVWAREAAMWRPDIAEIRIADENLTAWPGDHSLLAINYERLPKTVSELKELTQGGVNVDFEESLWDSVPPEATLILDECHFLKSNKTLRTARARALVKAVLRLGGRVWGGTGTPLLNRQIELWNLLTTLQLHCEAFGSFQVFADLFGAVKDHWDRLVWPDTKNGMSPEIAARLRRVMLRRLRKDVLPQLPQKIRQDVPIEIAGSARRMLDAAKMDLEARGITIEDAVAAAELGRFSGPEFATLSAANEELARALIPAALELVEGYEDAEELVIVWSDHRAPIQAFRNRPGWATIEGGMAASEKTAIENAFQAGKLKGLACSIKAAGTAITLTRAAHELFVDLSYVPGENDQAEDRCVRHGQTRGVVIRRLVPDHELCKRKLEIVTDKMQLIAGTVDAAAVVKAKPKVDLAALESMGQEER
ncbi:MAG: DEAD/DEAH box helicase [Verrucomicrobiota bacterium]|nr:DEAD/DEAH box helicase [Verrucomicrobiota bacterium]